MNTIMLQYSNLSRIMDAETISKNEANPKSRTSRNFLLGKCLHIKKFALTLTATLFALTSFAGDILTLNNEMVFEGKVTKIKGCEVFFKADRQTYIVPASEIYSIQFENIEDKVYTEYLKMDEENPDKCLLGKGDAVFHGKIVVHYVLGFLIGPFAMIGTACTNPTPEKGAKTSTMSQNKEMFSDPVYLKCYKKKAKGQFIVANLYGWSMSLLVGTLITAMML